MRILLVSVVAAVCSCLGGCDSKDDFKPAALPGIEAPAEWGIARRDYIENREGGPGATVQSVLDAEVARYKGWTPGVSVESRAEASAVLLLDATDLRRGKETAAGLPADPQLAKLPPDRMRVLLEVRPNGPVFVVRVREFDMPDAAGSPAATPPPADAPAPTPATGG